MKRTRLIAVALVAASSACLEDEAPPAPELARDVYARLGEPLPSATPAQRQAFARGRDVANRRFTAADGLGPGFNVSFCAACHEKPTIGGGAGRYRNFLVVGQRLADGSFITTGSNGVQQQFTTGAEARVPTDAQTTVTATRNPIPFFGAGLIAEISGAEILRRADATDADGDGISGRANYDRGFVGRFGRKAQTVSIEGFIRGPLFNHVGVTSNPLSATSRQLLPVPPNSQDDLLALGPITIVQAQAAAPDAPTVDNDGVPDPELGEEDLFDLVSFVMLMAAPLRETPTEATAAGETTFTTLGCGGCHAPTLLGPRGLLPIYSDLLLHDMGDALADGVRMNDAGPSEFRTQPLWGVSPVGPYLHDGRADTLDEAIRAHGGEASAAQQRYADLPVDARDSVIAFLQALGGREQWTAGLLPPNAPVPAVGAVGGPASALDAQEHDRFVRGRAVFDRDTPLAAGLGASFNGDSCRGCHFDPIIGGAGPVGVNVMRQGIVMGDTFTAPTSGTMAHRLATAVDLRPAVDPAANVFEQRQTPTVLGLGLVEQISDSTILARHDPLDADADGISGRAHLLSDGRIGRLGWKANVPSVDEFARDASFNEMGLTLPEQLGLSFGAASDADAVPDPELPADELEDLVFYMKSLAPPPRTRTNATLEDAGEDLFAAVGCVHCHVPVLQTGTGQEVPLYSDLLLHDVAAPDFVGIADGDASMREFRTPPLWGLANTGPYLHDGRAGSIEDAIQAHDTEASGVRQAFDNLPIPDRAALLAFLRSL